MSEKKTYAAPAENRRRGQDQRNERLSWLNPIPPHTFIIRASLAWPSHTCKQKTTLASLQARWSKQSSVEPYVASTHTELSEMGPEVSRQRKGERMSGEL